MKTEYEIRVLETDKEKLIDKLEELGAKKVGEFNQKRYVYDLNPVQENKWIRLRTNGKETKKWNRWRRLKSINRKYTIY